ncbi:MAG: tRNA dihydrouridine synthase DusB [Thermoanaerobacteraceae bacterium]|nr:tRNA dihydrouridine synthase DusB [Thermoanaerobacteraceae bacterium]
MAGVTDKVFRILAKEAGCGLVVTEMVSAKALTYNNRRTYKLIDISGEQPPVAIQLFGSEPGVMAEAAKIVEQIGADLVDVNMGCPTPKIVKNGEGAALMQQPALAVKIVEAMKQAVSIPVTVKMRAGWDAGSINAPELARELEAAGADMIAVHGRTREQFYSGSADWGLIAKVKSRVSVPVVGNGDIWQPEDAARMLEETGCDGVMIGRGSLGNPWIFKRTFELLRNGTKIPPPTPQEKVKMALRHLDMMVTFKGEYVAVREMRKHIAWYLKDMRNAARMRERVNQRQSVEDLRNLLQKYLLSLEDLP